MPPSRQQVFASIFEKLKWTNDPSQKEEDLLTTMQASAQHIIFILLITFVTDNRADNSSNNQDDQVFEDKNDENKENTQVKKVIEVLFKTEDDTDHETIIWDLLFGDNEEFVVEELDVNDDKNINNEEEESAEDDTYQEEYVEDENDIRLFN
uniref:Uncharacterized protein n=1 Tax=Strongyloides papillosus TaxID=174720 RepID=A0A0N5BP43_STREA